MATGPDLSFHFCREERKQKEGEKKELAQKLRKKALKKEGIAHVA